MVTRDRPDLIWSSFSGTWRQVSPQASGGLGTGGAEPGMMFSLAGLTLALIVVAVLITRDEAAWATAVPTPGAGRTQASHADRR